MVQGIALFVLALSTLHYLLFMTLVRIGLVRLDRQPRSKEEPFVSVVVAARNEERGISRCLESILDQTYKSNQYELIVVDDDSSDGTAEAVVNLARRRKNIRFLRLAPTADSEHGRKPEAIALGVHAARGDVILTTDADCVVPPRWIETMTSFIVPGIAFVSGPVAEFAADGLLSKMSGVEMLGLVTVGAGLVGARRPITCTGANLAYRKSDYLHAVAKPGKKSSNDDEALMSRIFRANSGGIAFAAAKEAVVRTAPEESAGRLILQRLRWSAKRGRYGEKSVLAILVGLYVFFACLVGIPWLILAEPLIAVPFFVVVLGKAFVDFMTLRAGARMTGSSFGLIPFIIGELLHPPYVVLVAGLAQFLPHRWKGRSVRQ